MTLHSLPAALMAAVTFWAGLHHLLVYVRGPRSRHHLAFALTCLVVSVYDVFCVGLYNATTVGEGARWQWLQALALMAGGLTFVHFVGVYTGRGPRWLRLGLLLGYGVCLAVSLVAPDGWVWSDRPLVKHVGLPWGGEVTYHEVEPGPMQLAAGLVSLAAFVYAFWAGSSLYRRGDRGKALPLLLATGLFCAGVANDTAVSAGLYDFVYVIEYAFLGLVATMAYSLSGEVLRSAAMEEALRRSRALLNETGILARIGGWDVDLRTNRVTWTEAVRLIHEVPPDYEATVEEDIRFYAPSSRPVIAEAVRRARELGQPYDLELELITARGNRRWVRAVGRPQFADGRCVRLSGTFQDITDRKVAEQELSATRALLTAAIEQTPAGILVAEAPDVRIRIANPAALGIRGAADVPLTDIPVDRHPAHWQTFWPDGRPCRPEELPLSQAVLYGRTSQNVEVIIRRTEGDDRWVLANAAPVRDAEGRVVAGVVVFADITDHRRLEEQLRRSQKMQAIGQLAGGVAHDFNNILQAIVGYTELAEDHLDRDHPALADLEEVRRAAQRAAGLTRQLLTFSRRETLRRVSLDVNETVSNLLKMLRRVLGEDIDLVVQAHAGLPPVYADPGQLEQVLLNLCLNCRDAMPAGGTITIRTSRARLDAAWCQDHPWAREGDFVVLAVSDTGAGIPPHIQDRVFEPFFTTKEVGQGTGLGLAIVYATVERHGGLIHLASDVGRGTTVSLYLPPADQAPAAEPAPPPAPRAAGGGETLLVAEDDPLVRGLAVAVLRGAGYRLLVAENGAEAVILFHKHASEINLAILDVLMPKQGGRDVFQALREVKPDLPVLFSSGYSYGTFPDGCGPGEAAPLLQKPYTPQTLLARVREMLDARSAPRGETPPTNGPDAA